jgi:hypothetical protein
MLQRTFRAAIPLELAPRLRDYGPSARYTHFLEAGEHALDQIRWARRGRQRPGADWCRTGQLVGSRLPLVAVRCSVTITSQSS